MECTFCTKVARNDKEWTPAVYLKTNDSPKETHNSPCPRSSLIQTTKSVGPVGFINKGYNLYANSILQILSVVLMLWNRVPSESNTLSPVLYAISLNLAVKKEFSQTCRFV